MPLDDKMKNRVEEMFVLALGGKFSKIDDSEIGGDWAACIHAMESCTVSEADRKASLGRLMTLQDPAARAAGCEYFARAAVLALDLAELARIRSALDGSPFVAEMVDLWCAIASGGDVRERAKELESGARHARAGRAVIDAEILLAMGSLAADDLEGARAAARRASRMARTEGILQHEYLANLVLARVRRRAGQVYLAQRILRALATVVPKPWQVWIEWEMAFACAQPVPASDGIFRAYKTCFVAASRGDRRGVAPNALTSVALEWEHLKEDERELRDLLDPTCALSSRLGHALAQGRLGMTPPEGIAANEVVVLVEPGKAGRWVFGAGVALASHTYARIEFAERRDGRVQTALAVLALAGPDGMDTDELFLRIYGFAFNEPKHGGTLRVLLHRLRTAVSEVARVESADGRWFLLCERGLSLVDPALRASLGERFLRVIAEKPMTVAEAADALGVSKRTIQELVKELSVDGACIADEGDRAARYRIEDTTFFEPSYTRLRGG